MKIKLTLTIFAIFMINHTKAQIVEENGIPTSINLKNGNSSNSFYGIQLTPFQGRAVGGMSIGKADDNTKRWYLFNTYMKENQLIERFEISYGGTTGLAMTKDLNMGLGTTSPTAKLHVFNGNNSYGTILANANEANFSLYAKTLTTQPINVESFRLGLKYASDENNGFISFYRGAGSSGGFLGLSTNGVERLRIATNGNIGIGTTNPLDKLMVQNGSIRIHGIDGKGIKFHQEDGRRFGRIFLSKQGGTGDGTPNTLLIEAGNMYGANYGQRILFKTADTDRFVIEHDGNVGIGTVNPGTWKLAVNGKIRAKEIKVETEWADFVFEDSYDLPSLEEVEKHIKDKGHLKDIPNAKEVEENGIFLGEMNAKLLQKIEELTLYLITQNKKVEKLETANKNLQERLLILEKR